MLTDILITITMLVMISFVVKVVKTILVPMSKRDRNKFIFRLHELIRLDWNNNPDNDKITSQGGDVGLIAIYKFDDGKEVEFHKTGYNKTVVIRVKGRRFHHDVSSFQWRQYVKMLNKVIEKANGENNRYGYNSRPRQRQQPKKLNPKHDHPKWDRYWGLITNIRQRTSNLDKLGKNDPDRSGLINELNTAKRQAKAMKDKYKF